MSFEIALSGNRLKVAYKGSFSMSASFFRIEEIENISFYDNSIRIKADREAEFNDEDSASALETYHRMLSIIDSFLELPKNRKMI